MAPVPVPSVLALRSLEDRDKLLALTPLPEGFTRLLVAFEEPRYVSQIYDEFVNGLLHIQFCWTRESVQDIRVRLFVACTK
jgi:hypothetical protein